MRLCQLLCKHTWMRHAQVTTIKTEALCKTASRLSMVYSSRPLNTRPSCCHPEPLTAACHVPSWLLFTEFHLWNLFLCHYFQGISKRLSGTVAALMCLLQKGFVKCFPAHLTKSIAAKSTFCGKLVCYSFGREGT